MKDHQSMMSRPPTLVSNLSQLDGLSKRARSFSFIKLELYQDRKTARPLLVDRKTDPLLERSAVVGEKIEDDTRALVQLLTKEVTDKSDSRRVVAIVGVGGIGKTILSKKIFNDEVIQGKFTKKIWLSITQEFNGVELLRTAIIAAADGKMPESAGISQDKAVLGPELVSVIRDKKFFLVLDDMWDISVWNNLLSAPFSHGAAGSRVLITTRYDAVARGMRAVQPYHHVSKLGHEDGWLLLTKQVLGMEKSDPEIDMLKDIGLQIIEKCDGLPLAIKVMGGLLCQKEKERRDWEKVLHDAIWSESQMPEELNYAIYLSYEDLSPCLKQCFLHFSLKPKNKQLDNMQLVSMWIAEGFIHGDSDILEELGSEYYKELISRNLIELDTSCVGQYICHMHDVICSFAHFMTKDEALVAHNGEAVSKHSLQRFLRLSIKTQAVESDEFEWRNLQEQKSLRSIILIGNLKIQPGDSLVTFSSLRTLHVESSNFGLLVESLCQLKHLRYLTVGKCNDIESLPENLHEMKFLQHISLDGCENIVKLPDSIVKLRELRYLDIDRTCIKSMPRDFHGLTNLRTLYGFFAHMDGDWCSLEELGPLSQLRAIGLVGLENVSNASFATKVRLGEKANLSVMSLDCSSRLEGDGLVKPGASEKDQGILEDVFDELCPPSCIEDIRIDGYFGRQLPRWIMSTAPAPLKSLKILMIQNLVCCTQLPNGLCQLPCLEFLKVSWAPAIKRVGPEFVQSYGQRNHTSSQPAPMFPRLHEMILFGLLECEEWEWEEEMQAMPLLEKLDIEECKLRCIPPGLPFHASYLKTLTLHRVQYLESIENFASVVELDLYDLPELTRISNFPKLQKLEIRFCEKLESLQEMTALRKLELCYREKELPLYLQTVKPSYLLLNCRAEILASMAVGESGPDWDKFSHIQHVEAYAADENYRMHYLSFTSKPYKMDIKIEPNLQDDGEEGGED
ncbi:disease resistance protein RGA2-like [Lolium rigidum]|uniref:disease resistance protein RGA2-like n=1 Tax=Lolium rigidum TaxID=89674 RepID=UPI001F5DD534|nr:disease resistance protein RGA2-like [Lolium rigidum]